MIQNICFLDIETIPAINITLGEDIPNEIYGLFEKKFRKDLQDQGIAELYREKAGLYAEFGKVVCVSIGKMQATKFFIKTMTNRDEKKLLIELAEAISKFPILCAHNGLEFDFPFLMRRYIINGLPIPPTLNVFGKKPWETPFEDTMKMWSGTAWNYKCSLDLLAHCLGLPSPKKDMDGSLVAEVYYSMFDDVKNDELPFEKEKQALDKIGKYCAGDIITLANVYCRMKGEPLIEKKQIEYV